MCFGTFFLKDNGETTGGGGDGSEMGAFHPGRKENFIIGIIGT